LIGLALELPPLPLGFVVTSPTALSANVRKGSDVLSEVSAEDSRETRIGLSAAARKAAETFAKMHGTKVIKHA